MEPVPSITSGLYIVNFPLIIFTVVVVFIVLCKFMKQQKVESTVGDNWLENESVSKQ